MAGRRVWGSAVCAVLPGHLAAHMYAADLGIAAVPGHCQPAAVSNATILERPTYHCLHARPARSEGHTHSWPLLMHFSQRPSGSVGDLLHLAGAGR